MPSPAHGAPPPHPSWAWLPHVEHTGGSPGQESSPAPTAPALGKEKPPIPANIAITQESGSAKRT